MVPYNLSAPADFISVHEKPNRTNSEYCNINISPRLFDGVVS